MSQVLSARRAWEELRRTPPAVQGYLAVAAVAALVLPPVLPVVLDGLGPAHPGAPEWFTFVVLVAVSMFNVELGRALTGGVSQSQQPHKALSAWAFCSALLLPPVWLLAVVPLTYLHARWRGLRVALWKWVGSALFLVLAGVAAALVRRALFDDRWNFMAGRGGHGLLVILAAAATFLVVEAALFAGTALLNDAEDEVWLRRTLRSPSFYVTEGGVILVGGLLAAVWTGGPWFVLIFLPIYALAQRAALHEPLRERAETAALLTQKNAELEQANRFKLDLLGMFGHEIGNPLTSVLGYAEVGSQAHRSGRSDIVTTSLEVIGRSAAQLRVVVEEILAMVSSDRGTLLARPETVPVLPRLEAAVSMQPPGHQPAVTCPSDLLVEVQPGHLDQILANLLGNAAKYAGGATRVVAGPAAGGRVEVVVEDDGPGVDPALVDRLFARFTRSEGTAHQVGGNGLGLFIARELARANGGDLVHRPRLPRGSVFVLSLPAGEVAPGPAVGKPVAVPGASPDAGATASRQGRLG